MATSPPPIIVETFEDTVKVVRYVLKLDLVSCAVRLIRLLLAVDLFPQGGVLTGHYAEQAIRRYWLVWMPLLHKHAQRPGGAATLKLLRPPLDVQWVWFVHRLNPTQYMADCVARFGCEMGPVDEQQGLGWTDGTDRGTESIQSRNSWEEMVASLAATNPDFGSPEYRFWPPAPPSVMSRAPTANATPAPAGTATNPLLRSSSQPVTAAPTTSDTSVKAVTPDSLPAGAPAAASAAGGKSTVGTVFTPASSPPCSIGHEPTPTATQGAPFFHSMSCSDRTASSTVMEVPVSEPRISQTAISPTAADPAAATPTTHSSAAAATASTTTTTSKKSIAITATTTAATGTCEITALEDASAQPSRATPPTTPLTCDPTFEQRPGANVTSSPQPVAESTDAGPSTTSDPASLAGASAPAADPAALAGPAAANNPGTDNLISPVASASASRANSMARTASTSAMPPAPASRLDSTRNSTSALPPSASRQNSAGAASTSAAPPAPTSRMNSARISVTSVHPPSASRSNSARLGSNSTIPYAHGPAPAPPSRVNSGASTSTPTGAPPTASRSSSAGHSTAPVPGKGNTIVIPAKLIAGSSGKGMMTFVQVPARPEDMLAAARAATSGRSVEEPPEARASVQRGTLESVRWYVVRALPRQGRFLHQVLRSPYLDSGVLNTAQTRYCRFLATARRAELIAAAPSGSSGGVPPPSPQVPMYDIDLMWHAHMAMAGNYAACTRALLGRVYSHDDTIEPPMVGSLFEHYLKEYELSTGLLYNVTPTRRLPYMVAHPLTQPFWPLAAALNTPEAMASPEEVGAEVEDERGRLRKQRAQQERAFFEAKAQAYRERRAEIRVPPVPLPLSIARPEEKDKDKDKLGRFGRRGARGRGRARGREKEKLKERARSAQGEAEEGKCVATKGRYMPGSLLHVGRCGAYALYAVWAMGEAMADKEGLAEGSRRCGHSGVVALGRALRDGMRRLVGKYAPRPGDLQHGEADWMVQVLASAFAALCDLHSGHDTPLAHSDHPFLTSAIPLPPRSTPLHPDAVTPPLDLPATTYRHPYGERECVYMAPDHYYTNLTVLYTPADYCLLGEGRWVLPKKMEKKPERMDWDFTYGYGPYYEDEDDSDDECDEEEEQVAKIKYTKENRHPNALGRLVHRSSWDGRIMKCYAMLYEAAGKGRMGQLAGVWKGAVGAGRFVAAPEKPVKPERLRKQLQKQAQQLQEAKQQLVHEHRQLIQQHQQRLQQQQRAASQRAQQARMAAQRQARLARKRQQKQERARAKGGAQEEEQGQGLPAQPQSPQTRPPQSQQQTPPRPQQHALQPAAAAAAARPAGPPQPAAAAALPKAPSLQSHPAAPPRGAQTPPAPQRQAAAPQPQASGRVAQPSPPPGPQRQAVPPGPQRPVAKVHLELGPEP